MIPTKTWLHCSKSSSKIFKLLIWRTNWIRRWMLRWLVAMKRYLPNQLHHQRKWRFHSLKWLDPETVCQSQKKIGAGKWQKTLTLTTQSTILKTQCSYDHLQLIQSPTKSSTNNSALQLWIWRVAIKIHKQWRKENLIKAGLILQQIRNHNSLKETYRHLLWSIELLRDRLQGANSRHSEISLGQPINRVQGKSPLRNIMPTKSNYIPTLNRF